MKKILTIAVASLVIAAVADSYSPQIGVTTLSLSLKNNILPVQFTSLTNGNVTADALVCTNNIPLNSYLFVYNDGYSAWQLQETGWVGLGISSDIGGISSATAGAANTELIAGSAIWLSFPDAKATRLVSVYGKVAASTNITIVAGKSNLICNPKGTDATLVFSDGFTPTKGDKITVVGTETYSGYYVYNGTVWKKVTVSGMEDAGTISIPAYCGCWYVSKATGASPGSIVW